MESGMAREERRAGGVDATVLRTTGLTGFTPDSGGSSIVASHSNPRAGKSRRTGQQPSEESHDTPIEPSGERGEEDTGRRQSGRAQTRDKRRTEPPPTESPAKKPKLMKSAELPPKDFKLVALLDSGVTGEEASTVLGLEDLSGEKRTALEEFWKAMIKKDQTLNGDRFNSWFKGSSFEDKCFAMMLGPRQKCAWENGKGYACKYCLKSEKPCCRVVLDDGKPVGVTVLPKFGKTGQSRFSYWK